MLPGTINDYIVPFIGNLSAYKKRGRAKPYHGKRHTSTLVFQVNCASEAIIGLEKD